MAPHGFRRAAARHVCSQDPKLLSTKEGSSSERPIFARRKEFDGPVLSHRTPSSGRGTDPHAFPPQGAHGSRSSHRPPGGLRLKAAIGRGRVAREQLRRVVARADTNVDVLAKNVVEAPAGGFRDQLLPAPPAVDRSRRGPTRGGHLPLSTSGQVVVLGDPRLHGRQGGGSIGGTHHRQTVGLIVDAERTILTLPRVHSIVRGGHERRQARPTLSSGMHSDDKKYGIAAFSRLVGADLPELGDHRSVGSHVNFSAAGLRRAASTEQLRS
jgi:hypothetical protein